jgi:hypothetical protein
MPNSKSRAIEPEGHRHRADEDDVEGHRKHRAVDDDVEGHSGRTLRATGDDDVEGHSGRTLRATGDDDVEGHSGRTLRATGDEDDAEGHMMGNPLLNQQLARAREQDIQRNLRAHEARSEASRPHKK